MKARFLLPLLVIAAALAALLATPAEQPILGLAHGAFARAAGGAALLLALFGAAMRSARPSDFTRVAGGALTWATLALALTGVYAYRFEAEDVAQRVLAELLPAEPQVGQGGEVVVSRQIGGSFVVAGKVNGVKVPFLFDTGASTVVLTAEDARRVGIREAALEYDAPVSTANGAAMAAETRVGEISVGPIALRNVRALVARPGALSESLLGMSFLERLQSYGVERGKLVLRAR